MKILHVIQSLEREKGGGVTARNLKLIEYLEKKNNKNFIISLKSKDKNIYPEGFIYQKRNYSWIIRSKWCRKIYIY